jgi:hypothetical protein
MDSNISEKQQQFTVHIISRAGCRRTKNERAKKLNLKLELVCTYASENEKLVREELGTFVIS